MEQRNFILALVALAVLALIAAFFLGFFETDPGAKATSLAANTREGRLMQDYQSAFNAKGQCSEERYRTALAVTLEEENLGKEVVDAVMARYKELEEQLKACTPSVETSSSELRTNVYRVTYEMVYPEECLEENRAPVLLMDVDTLTRQVGRTQETGISDAAFKESKDLLELFGPCTGPYLASRYVGG